MKLISGLLTLLAFIASSTSSSVDELQQDLNICNVNRERLDQKVLTLERENESLKRKIEGLNLDLAENQEDLKEFNQRFDQLLEDLSRQANVEGTGQVLALQKVVTSLQFKIETLEINYREAHKQLQACQSKPNECPPCDPYISRSRSAEYPPTSTCDSYIEILNQNFQECQAELATRGNEVSQCESKKSQISIALDKCQKELAEPPSSGRIIYGQCDAKILEEFNKLRQFYYQCLNNQNALKFAQKECNQKLIETSLKVDIHRQSFETCEHQKQAQKTQYVHLWESCTDGIIPDFYHPKCYEIISTKIVPKEILPSGFFSVIFDPEKQCKIYTDANVREQLKECETKLASAESFVSSIGGVLSLQIDAIRRGNIAPNVGACVAEDDPLETRASFKIVEATTTSTEPTTTTTEAPQECVVEWKTLEQSARSLSDGFILGKAKDGTDLHVGRAWYNRQHTPAALKLSGEGYGAYLVHGPKQRHLTSDIEYLSITPSCRCSFVRCKNCTSVANVVEYFTSDWNEMFWITKQSINYNCGGSTCSYDILGEAFNARNFHWYPDANGNTVTKQTRIYNVLQCSK